MGSQGSMGVGRPGATGEKGSMGVVGRQGNPGDSGMNEKYEMLHHSLAPGTKQASSKLHLTGEEITGSDITVASHR